MIALERVGLSYGRVAALREISLEVPRGSFFVLIGPSGSGKTTTLHLINRLIEPSAGRVLIDGVDARGADPVALRRGMGFIFQAVGLFPHLSVAENVGVTPRLLGWPPERIAARVEALLALVQLAPGAFRDRLPAALSGGQQQRVGLARALAAEPAIMLMDEPFGALDPLTRDDLSAEYRAIHDKLGLTTVLVTHDMTEALMLADTIAVMREGAIVQVGSPNALISAPADDFVRALIETPRRRAAQLAKALQVSA